MAVRNEVIVWFRQRRLPITFGWQSGFLSPGCWLYCPFV